MYQAFEAIERAVLELFPDTAVWEDCNKTDKRARVKIFSVNTHKSGVITWFSSTNKVQVQGSGAAIVEGEIKKYFGQFTTAFKAVAK
eukprot:g12069.t1